MQVSRISPNLSVTSQILAADMPELSALGFRTLINNRPDGESNDQPSNADLEVAAREHGLGYCYLPVVPGKLGSGDVARFSSVLRDLTGPVLAFCRTGTRSVTLWALSEAGHLDSEAIIATAREAGFDLGDLRPRLTVAVARRAVPVLDTGSQPAPPSAAHGRKQ